MYLNTSFLLVNNVGLGFVDKFLIFLNYNSLFFGVDDWLVDFMNVLFMDDWLMYFMDNWLMMFVNDGLVLFLDNIFVVFVNDVLVLFFDDSSLDVFLDDWGFKVLNNFGLQAFFLNNGRFDMLDDDFFLSELLDDWLFHLCGAIAFFYKLGTGETLVSLEDLSVCQGSGGEAGCCEVFV